MTEEEYSVEEPEQTVPSPVSSQHRSQRQRIPARRTRARSMRQLTSARRPSRTRRSSMSGSPTKRRLLTGVSIAATQAPATQRRNHPAATRRALYH